jgi:hypothetical protein
MNESKNLSPEKGSFIFRFLGKEYQIYGDRIINDDEAAQIHEKLLSETSLNPGEKKGSS